MARVLRWGPGYTGGEDPLNLLRDVIEAEEIRLDRWTVVFHPEDKQEDVAQKAPSTSTGKKKKVHSAQTSQQQQQNQQQHHHAAITTTQTQGHLVSTIRTPIHFDYILYYPYSVLDMVVFHLFCLRSPHVQKIPNRQRPTATTQRHSQSSGRTQSKAGFKAERLLSAHLHSPCQVVVCLSAPNHDLYYLVHLQWIECGINHDNISSTNLHPRVRVVSCAPLSFAAPVSI